ncbi:hypothetical protein BTM25_38320 [Actinomadura rubteroloni]|uniref:Uncharacterized protein n=1 Tax=Actinomadura rubteroloni TaxID=1926885 RepID=A0A2P4UJF5_9ACTN|nr:hypothetical protein [Actinomadura rubteroloni]POM25189.1 hypothetical protein BTM25_38320 [Actinomadura rubteroloni]
MRSAERSLTTVQRFDQPGDRHRADDPARTAHLALSLITVWSIRTGRRLRAAPISDLTAAELETFWADPLMDDEPP